MGEERLPLSPTFHSWVSDCTWPSLLPIPTAMGKEPLTVTEDTVSNVADVTDLLTCGSQLWGVPGLWAAVSAWSSLKSDI